MDAKNILSAAGWSLHGSTVNVENLAKLAIIYYVNLSAKQSSHIHVFSRSDFAAAADNPRYQLQRCVDSIGNCQVELYTAKRAGVSADRRKRLYDLFSDAAINYIVQTQSYSVFQELSAKSDSDSYQFIIVGKRYGPVFDVRPVIPNMPGNAIMSPDDVCKFAVSTVGHFM